MATSSILENVTLSSPEAINMFVDALEESANMPRRPASDYRYHIEKDPEEVAKFIEHNRHGEIR